jgi:hypothetical protein
MPPEPEDLNRQLQALQRYVAELNEQRKRQGRGGPTGADTRARRPSKRWLLFTGLLAVMALTSGLFVGAVAWSDDRPPTATAAAGASSVTPSSNTTSGRASRPVGV